MEMLKKIVIFQKNITELSDEKVKEIAVLMPGLNPQVMTKTKQMEVDLEDALELAGCGRYQLYHCALMLAILAAALLEMIGIAFVLPAAACDLDMPDSMKGIITSIPNLGIIITAPFWGYASDSLGRKPTLLLSTAVAGILGISAALMPNLLSFALCKLATSLFLSCPSSLTFAYACELMPRRRRDKAVLLLNGLLMIVSTLSPVFAWAVLSTKWQYSLGSLVLRPWRLLTAVYSVPLLLSALWLVAAEESPKFLMTKRREEAALNVLRRVYEVNTRMPADTYCVHSLKGASESIRVTETASSGSELAIEDNESALSLLRPPHLKWLTLTGFLMFGLFSLLNGLFLMAPDIINKVMSDTEAEGTVCTLIDQLNSNVVRNFSIKDMAPDIMNKVMSDTEAEGTVCTLIDQPNSNVTSNACTYTISQDTFSIMAVTTLISGVLVTLGSMSPLSKKTLLIIMYGTVGVACLTSRLSPFRLLTGVAMSALQLTALGIGPLTAYAVALFPTSLRGTAVGAVLMFGRVGSAAGANAAGYFLATSCTATFYGFAVLTFVCGALSFLLPSEKEPSVSNETLDTETG